MFKEILEYLWYHLKRVATSRLFPLGCIFAVMFSVLIIHLYQLQIVEGANAQESYVDQMTLRTISLSSTRGNIYDRNGTLLAYNELVYSVTLKDTGAYNGYQKNMMIMELLKILDRHGEKIVEEIPIFINSAGEMEFSIQGNSRQRFLRDAYGKKSVDELTDEQKNVTAQGLYEYFYDRYGIGKKGSGANAETYEIDTETALRVMNIRYLLNSNSYQRYRSVVVSSNVSEETMTDVLEHADSMDGVDVEEDYQRVYTDSTYFAHVIGYTGKASSEELETLNADYAEGEERYELGDVIGKTGIEASMESELQGIKGSRTMYLDSLGHIMEVTDETAPVTGNDVYLTIDHDLQVGIYHLVEQNLAGILVDKLVNDKVYNPAGTSASERKLSIYEAYYQLINNNILDMSAFADADAGDAEKRIQDLFLQGQDEAVSAIRAELLSPNPTPYKDLGGEVPEGEDNFMKIYVSYVYDVLADAGYLLTDAIDTNDETYIAYKNDETIGLSEFLRYALSQNWIDVSKLSLDSKYTSAEDTYQILVDQIGTLLRESSVFNKRVYKNLIYNQKISGCDICLALFEQGILESDQEAIQKLMAGTDITSYEFLLEKIKSLEITPAQLAMDPCSAAVTITDVHSGDVLAVVSYPSYDNNRLSGSVDAKYYSSLANDMSSPLYSTATQAQKAPGSVFKLVTTAAALENGVVTRDEVMLTDSVFTKQGLKLSCAGGVNHGNLNIVQAIRDSCNYFFSEMGFRLSLADPSLENTDQETYVEQKGVDTIRTYAAQFGLDRKTGIQLNELEPHISDTAPIPSAIGQGTHAFSNVQLARYATTIANSGTVYDLTLLDKLTDSDGNLLEEYTPTIVGTTTFASTTWDTIHDGMRSVVADHLQGRSDGEDIITCKVDIAGKTGTAEESKLRPNHANFISYAPYDNPEIAVVVSIPYGYTSSNAARIASNIYDFYYGELTLEEIQASGASKASTAVVND